MNLRSTWWHTLLKWHRWGRLRRRASVGPLAWWPNLLHRTYSRFHLIPKSAYFSVVVHTVGRFEWPFWSDRRNKCLLLLLLTSSLFSFFLRLVDNFIELASLEIFTFSCRCITLFTFQCFFWGEAYSELSITAARSISLYSASPELTFLFSFSSLRLLAFFMDSRKNWLDFSFR